VVFGLKKNPLQKFIKNVLGYKTRHIHLYELALTHRSAGDRSASKAIADNERLEYLGDAVLGCIIAGYLYVKYPCVGEGFLTTFRSRLVCREYLNRLSCRIGLDEHVRRINNGNKCTSIYGDALEALIGAVYIDKGYEFTKKLVINRILGMYVDVNAVIKTDTNYKNKVLMWSQKNKHTIDYRLQPTVSIKNTRKQFVVHLYIDNEYMSEGCDFSIKSAEQQAAMFACEKLEIIHFFN
jgi:ribonuclease-3